MHERERVGAMERCVKCGQLWPCRSSIVMASTVLVVSVEERQPMPRHPDWFANPEMTRVFAESAEGWVAAREYGMSLDANTYSYDIVAKVVE